MRKIVILLVSLLSVMQAAATSVVPERRYITFKNNSAYVANLEVKFEHYDRVSAHYNDSRSRWKTIKLETSDIILGDEAVIDLSNYEITSDISVKVNGIAVISGVDWESNGRETLILDKRFYKKACFEAKGSFLSASADYCDGGVPINRQNNLADVEKACYERIQGKVAWSNSGDTKWSDQNIETLCKGVKPDEIRERINCFSSKMPSSGWREAISSCTGASDGAAEANCYNQIQGKVAWSTSGDKSWNPDNVKSLCKGVTEHTITGRIMCFSSQMLVFGWEKSISNCSQTFE